MKTLREEILSPQPGVPPGPSHAATPASHRLAACTAALSPFFHVRPRADPARYCP